MLRKVREMLQSSREASGAAADAWGRDDAALSAAAAAAAAGGGACGSSSSSISLEKALRSSGLHRELHALEGKAERAKEVVRATRASFGGNGGGGGGNGGGGNGGGRK
jgi:hypothetical protein